MTKRCFLCGAKMDENTGLCTNPDCVRSQPLPNPEAKVEAKVADEEKDKSEDKT